MSMSAEFIRLHAHAHGAHHIDLVQHRQLQIKLQDRLRPFVIHQHNFLANAEKHIFLKMIPANVAVAEGIRPPGINLI